MKYKDPKEETTFNTLVVHCLKKKKKKWYPTNARNIFFDDQDLMCVGIIRQGYKRTGSSQ